MPETIESGLLHRSLDLERVDTKSRSIDLSFSSEEPYDRFFGVEILDHKADSVRLDRLRRTGVALWNHDTDRPVGTLSDIRLDGTKGRARVTFFDDEDGERILSRVKQGLRNVSVGYRVHSMVLEKQSDEGPDVYRVDDWEPFEVSVVSVPADVSVGVGRDTGESYQIQIRGNEMTTETTGETSRRQAAALKAGAEQERQRAADIRLVAKQFPDNETIKQLAERAIDDGMSADEFGKAALRELGNVNFTPKPLDTRSIPGYQDADRQRFSITRLIRGLAATTCPGLVDARTAKEWANAAGHEFETLAAFKSVLKRDPKDERAVSLPLDLLVTPQTRLLDMATEAADLRQTTNMSELFAEALRARSVVLRAGARELPGLVGNIVIPTQTGAGAVTWLAESGSAADTTPTFGQVALSPKTMAARTDVSRRMLLQSSLAMDTFVGDDLSLSIITELDRVAIEGNPDVTATANEPRGVINSSGIGSVALGTHGAAPTRANLVNLITEIAQDNALRGTPKWLMNAQTVGFLMNLLVDSGSGKFVMEQRDMCLGYEVLETQNVPSDLAKGTGTGLHAIIIGDFSEMIVASWSGVDILLDPYTQGATGALRVVAFSDVDIGIRRAVSFAAIVDAVIT